MTHPLKEAIIRSAIGHFVVFLVFGILSLFQFSFFSKSVDITWVELPKGASEEIGTGIKKVEDLPKSTIEEQKRPPEPEPQKETLKSPPSKEILAPKKEEMKPAKLSPKAKKEKPLTPQEKKMRDALAGIDKQLKQRSAPPEAAQIEKGGEGYKHGTGTEALRVPPSDPEYLKYQADVRMKIINEWIIPPLYADEKMEVHFNTKIAVMMDDEGNVTATRWEGRSGNAAFDASALRAIQRASPLPKPPARLAWESFNEGFLIEFDPRLKQ
ncbi:MAG: cell envelope integrity protein TolA [Deltaproteobacteria bacterium]|nr:cell envelope integrity protein TolA [Deltaproteobacteria bacterium]